MREQVHNVLVLRSQGMWDPCKHWDVQRYLYVEDSKSIGTIGIHISCNIGRSSDKRYKRNKGMYNPEEPIK